MDLPERIRSYREKNGFSQDELATCLGVSRVTIIRWENGSVKPSQLAAKKLEESGFGNIGLRETNIDEIPRIDINSDNSSKKYVSKNILRDDVRKSIKINGKPENFAPSPYVYNGPSNQMALFEVLYTLQEGCPKNSRLSRKKIAQRLSLVKSVNGLANFTSQYLLEKPKTSSKHWNTSYGPHGWHRYVGRFPPHLVRALLNYFGANKNTIVLDPFAGSGTTLSEARLLGIPSIGIEICPLSCLISTVKSKFSEDYTIISKIKKNLNEFYEKKWKQYLKGKDIKSIKHESVINRKGNMISPFANYKKWMTVEALLGTSFVLEYASKLTGYERNILLIALSSKMRSIGNVDVDVVRAEYREIPRENVNVLALVERQLKVIESSIQLCYESHNNLIGKPDSIQIIQGDVLETNLNGNSIDYVITSPPYGVEASSYLRAHLLSYRCLEHFFNIDPYEFGNNVIGSEYLNNHKETISINNLDNVSKTYQAFFQEFLENPENSKLRKRIQMMMHFFEEMSVLADKLNKWLKKKGKIAFVIGNKKLGDAVIPTDKIIIELFKNKGLQFDKCIAHKLKCNNSNSQVPW